MSMCMEVLQGLQLSRTFRSTQYDNNMQPTKVTTHKVTEPSGFFHTSLTASLLKAQTRWNDLCKF